MSKTIIFIAVAFVLNPPSLMAESHGLGDYRAFTLTTEEKSHIFNAADNACFITAATAANENARIKCNSSVSKRLNKQLKKSYRSALASLPRARVGALRLDEAAWLANRDTRCASTDANQLNPTSVSYRVNERLRSDGTLQKKSVDQALQMTL